MSDQMLKSQLMAQLVTLFQMEPMARLIERIQEADSQTLEEFFWYLEMEMEG